MKNLPEKRKGKGIVFTALSSMLAVMMLSGCLPYSTKPDEVGVRTIKFSLTGKTGVEEKTYAPGTTQFFVPFVTDWHTFSITEKRLEMIADPGRGDRAGRDDIIFKTIDGNDIQLDLVVTYRLIREMAPTVLQNVAVNDEQLKDNVVRTIARSKPRDIFGELMTEAFYRAADRSAKAQEVKEKLNEILEPYGVTIVTVGPKDYRFNPEYQKAIEDKKVADQQVEKNKSATKAAREEYLKRVEVAKGSVAEMRAQADGEYLRAEIEAEAYYAQQSRIAEAIEAEGRAAAEGIQKMNEALSGGGGEAMVRMSIAEALMNKRIILLPIGGGGLDVRTTDINSLLQLYGLQEVAKPRSR